ncbi:unnamed protein product [Auanema sp. JU1783]|nr:unnamed protein product [Auanema sp. JU1783]
MLWTVLILYLCTHLIQAIIPPPYLIPHKTAPPNTPFVVKVAIDVYETFMQFDSDTLTIHGSLRLTWKDKRKAYNSTDYHSVSFFSGINDKEYKTVEKNIWVPGIKSQLQLLTFRSSSFFNGETISPYMDGTILYSMRFVMAISCTQVSINFPFETYSCYQVLLDAHANGNYAYKPIYPGENIMNLNFNSKHNGHAIRSINSSVLTRNMHEWDKSGTLDIPYIEFGFVLQRVSPRLITTIFVPTLAIGFIDALLFIFSRNLYLNCAMIPAFCLYFQDLTLKNTVEEFPPLVKYFYARFITSVLCNLWNFILCISKDNTSKDIDVRAHDLTDNSSDELTADISYMILLHSLLSSWKRRLIVVLVFFVVFYAILSINLTNLPTSVIKEPNY